MNKRDWLRYCLLLNLYFLRPLATTATVMPKPKAKPISIFAFDPNIDIAQFGKNCRHWGIDAAILHPGYFDGSRNTQAILAEHGLKLWLNLPVFHNPEFLDNNPDHYSITSRGNKAIHDWCHFVCPSHEDYIEKLIDTYSELARKLQPARISLDFIRFFVFWEQVDMNGSYQSIEDGCYCPRCLQNFSQTAGVKLAAKNATEYIRSHQQRAWGQWKAQHIGAIASRFIQRLRSACPQSLIWIKTIPWHASDAEGAIIKAAGQDITQLASMVDGLAPMAFSHMLKQNLAWKTALLARVGRQTGKPLTSYLQFESTYREQKISDAQMLQELEQALLDTSADIALFHYEQLLQNPNKAERLRKQILAYKARF